MGAYQLPPWVWPAAISVVCLLAAWRGREEERLSAGAYLRAWALTLVVFRARREATQVPVLMIDVALLAVFSWIALRSRRYWPLFAAAFQLLAVMTHLARLADTAVTGWAYQTAGLVWAYLVIVSIGYGAWTAPRHAVSTDEPIDAAGATRR